MLPITIILIFVAYVLGTRIAQRFGDRIIGPMPEGLRELEAEPLGGRAPRSRPGRWLICVPGVVVVLITFSAFNRSGLAFEPMVVLIPLAMTAVTISVRLVEHHRLRRDAMRRVIALGGRRQCPDCGYDLRHGEGQHCPECGREL